MRLLAAIAVILGATWLSGCASAPDPDFDIALDNAYTVDSGDILRLTVFDQPDLTGSFAVNKAGEIAIPLVGTLQVRNLTTEAIDAEITRRLAAKYLRNPDVSIEIGQYRPFFIMGEVASGGQYAYVAGLTIEAAVATAGGFTPRAWKYSVTVTRKVGDQLVTRRLKMTDPVRPGDTIRVGERHL